jgi:protein N-terminal amidase
VRLNCFVVVGFPEDKDGKYFNSQAMVSRKGSLLHVYQKHFLYETDENWAEEGDAFSSVKIEGLGQLGFGICMDVNPYQFKAPFSAFEFAAFHKERASKLLLLSMNWLTHENKPNVRDLNAMEQKPLDYPAEKESEDLAFEHLNYWCIRLSPLLKTNVKVAICNRTGREGNTAYVGSSCVIDMMQPAVLGNLNRTQECVLIVEI